jgi:hypothetical protein
MMVAAQVNNHAPRNAVNITRRFTNASSRRHQWLTKIVPEILPLKSSVRITRKA